MSKDVKEKDSRLTPSFVTGAIALSFLVIGYQTALFIHRAAALRLLSNAVVPDTVFVSGGESCIQDAVLESESSVQGRECSVGLSGRKKRYPVTERRPGKNPPAAVQVAAELSPRTYESFKFDPNTVSVADLCRLGFSVKQARAIDNYRSKGGRFRRKSDFAKSFVVADSVYSRREKYIDIPLLDINQADSAAFDALPGIGGYFASRMVEYRERLGGYSYKEQLTDIRNLDIERLSAFQDLIKVGPSCGFRLWSLPEDSLALHPYVGRRAAHSIVLYRNNNPRSLWTVKGLADAGVLDAETASRLSRCRIAAP